MNFYHIKNIKFFRNSICKFYIHIILLLIKIYIHVINKISKFSSQYLSHNYSELSLYLYKIIRHLLFYA